MSDKHSQWSDSGPIKRNNCIEGDIYIVEGMCETLIMFKTLLAGTKLNLCQNKKRNRYIEKEDFIGVGQISEPLLAKMWLRVRPRPPVQTLAILSAGARVRTARGLRLVQTTFNPWHHVSTLHILLYSPRKTQGLLFCKKKTALSLIKSRLALGSPGCLFGHFFVRHHAKITLQTRKWLLTASK